MNVKEITDEKLIKNIQKMCEELEDRIIIKTAVMNEEQGINDNDLYFLSDMLCLTRSFSNLLDELNKIGKAEKEETP